MNHHLLMNVFIPVILPTPFFRYSNAEWHLSLLVKTIQRLRSASHMTRVVGLFQILNLNNLSVQHE